MLTETWETTGDNITPQDLRDDPNRYGGVGMIMLAAVQQEVHTVGLKRGRCHVSIHTNEQEAARIVRDGGVTISSDKYWCSIKDLNIKVCFLGTSEPITRK